MTWKQRLGWLSWVLDIWASPLLVFIMRSAKWGLIMARPRGQHAPRELSRACVPASESQGAQIIILQAAIFGHQVDCSIWYLLFLKEPKKGSAWVKVWFLECFNFCISRFLFFSVCYQTYYWISLGIWRSWGTELSTYTGITHSSAAVQLPHWGWENK